MLSVSHFFLLPLFKIIIDVEEVLFVGVSLNMVKYNTTQHYDNKELRREEEIYI